MPDREKVIKDLHDIAGFIAGRVGIEQARNFLRTIDDVIALLKEQEAIEPQKAPFPDASRSDGSWFYICGACSKAIDPNDKYCRWCGQAVMWDDD